MMAPTRRRSGPFTSILCPVDFSTHSQAALKYAAVLAHRAGGLLTALYVNDPFLVSAAAAAYNERTLTAQSEAELDRFVHRAIGDRAGSGPVSTMVALGEPAHEILKIAKKTRAGLIVVGSEGLSGALKLFFGSTTARILSKADIPVLAVPPTGPTPARAGGWPGPRVLAAVDLGRHAAQDVAAAAALARWFGVSLTLAHVVEKMRTPRWLSLKPGAHDRVRVAQARKRLGRLAEKAGPPGFADAHVFVGEPADQIAALAADVGAGLVVVTLRGDHRLLGDRQGTTTYRIVCEAGTPVLAVPAGWRLVLPRK